MKRTLIILIGILVGILAMLYTYASDKPAFKKLHASALNFNSNHN